MASKGKSVGTAANFILELLSILSEGPSELVDWTPNGQAFVIWDAERFADTVLERRFKSSNFASFVRQLNFYGFRKMNKSSKGHDPRVWEFQHVHFVRDRPDLLAQIKRRTAHDHNGRNDVEVLRTELDDVRASNSLLREAVLKLYDALVDAVGSDATEKLDLPVEVFDVVEQQRAVRVGSRSSKSRKQEFATSAHKAVAESGRKRARTESTFEYSKRSEDSAKMATRASHRRSPQAKSDEPTADTPSESETAIGGSAFELGSLGAAIFEEPAPLESPDPAPQKAQEAFTLDRVPSFSSMADYEATPKVGHGPALTRLHSFSDMPPMDAFESSDPATVNPRVDPYDFLVQDPEIFPTPYKPQALWEQELLDSPSLTRMPSWSGSMHNPASALTTPRFFGLQDSHVTPKAELTARSVHQSSQNTSSLFSSLSEVQKMEVVRAISKYLFGQPGSDSSNLERVVASPSVQQALRANCVAADVADPAGCLQQFISVVRPDVVLACLYPLIPHIQQIIAQVTMMASISLATANTLARTSSSAALSKPSDW